MMYVRPVFLLDINTDFTKITDLLREYYFGERGRQLKELCYLTPHNIGILF
jgi:hypothetical protein